MREGAAHSFTQPVTDGLLRHGILPGDAHPFEKVSGAMAVRAALRDTRPLVFMVPEATSSTARHITAALLIGNHAHSHGGSALPADEVRPLFQGDALLVTQSISESKGELESLTIGGRQKLSDIWNVTSLSKYTAGSSDKPRVFLANPGWLQGVTEQNFGVIVIDASHPRTFKQIPELLKSTARWNTQCFVVSPPWNDAMLQTCGFPHRIDVWPWDAQTKADAYARAPVKFHTPLSLGDRFVWECDSDEAAAAVLSKLHDQLVLAARTAAGQPYPGLRECWTIYHRLCQLLVSLPQLEEVSAATWGGNLRARVAELDDIHGPSSVARDTTWPDLVNCAKSAYSAFLSRKETAKFWALASNLESFLASPTPYLRIVIGSESERGLVVPMYDAILDGFTFALAEGRIEFVTIQQEARLIAEGHTAPTVLLSPRLSAFRYLDMFHSKRVDLFLYPHEIGVECTSQARLFETWSKISTGERLAALLNRIDIRSFASSSDRTTPCRSLIRRKANHHPVELVVESGNSAVLDIEGLLEISSGQDIPYACQDAPYSTAGAKEDLVDVRFTNGTRQRFYANQRVDVYFAQTESVNRHRASELRPGWKVVTFVDGQYDGLFQRLTEVVSARLPPTERIALELWYVAKQKLVARFESKRALYDALSEKGLSSEYGTFISWFRDEYSVIAPRQFADFEIVAMETHTYPKPAMLEATFRAVQHERGRNRTAGRKLKDFLRAVISGDDYEESLTSARKLDTALADVLAAVEVLEVDSVRALERNVHV